MANRKYVLTFRVDLVDKPLTYKLVKEYDVAVNILQAKINPEEEETGRMVVELIGEDENLQKSVDYLTQQGVQVRPHSRDIVWHQENCVNCGACTGVCHSRALSLDSETWTIDFDHSMCIVCGICVDACPVGAIKIAF